MRKTSDRLPEEEEDDAIALPPGMEDLMARVILRPFVEMLARATEVLGFAPERAAALVQQRLFATPPERPTARKATKRTKRLRTQSARQDDGPLTDQEEAVVALLAEGLSHTHIGRRLGITRYAVRWRVKRAYEKLGGREQVFAWWNAKHQSDAE